MGEISGVFSVRGAAEWLGSVWPLSFLQAAGKSLLHSVACKSVSHARGHHRCGEAGPGRGGGGEAWPRARGWATSPHGYPSS